MTFGRKESARLIKDSRTFDACLMNPHGTEEVRAGGSDWDGILIPSRRANLRAVKLLLFVIRPRVLLKRLCLLRQTRRAAAKTPARHVK